LKKKEKVIPFRESALTTLMKNSLVGNCKTCLIVTVADHPDMIQESVSSMRFGMECGALKKKTVTQANVVDIDKVTFTLKSQY
jgi:kinesin family protein 6/9